MSIQVTLSLAELKTLLDLPEQAELLNKRAFDLENRIADNATDVKLLAEKAVFAEERLNAQSQLFVGVFDNNANLQVRLDNLEKETASLRRANLKLANIVKRMNDPDSPSVKKDESDAEEKRRKQRAYESRPDVKARRNAQRQARRKSGKKN